MRVIFTKMRKLQLNLLKCFFIFLLVFSILMILRTPTNYMNSLNQPMKLSKLVNHENTARRLVENNNWRNLSKSQIDDLSELGRYLFLSEPRKPQEPKRNYKILIWKYNNTIKQSHIQNFNGHNFDPFDGCSVTNCKLSYDEKDEKNADAILFHLHRTTGLQDLPENYDKNRNQNQLWIFFTDESPYHTFLSLKVDLSMFDGIFNWSMTYRMDSDVPAPYGRTVLLEEEKPYYINLLNNKQDVLVAIMESNCGGNNDRWKYVKELQKYINVDVYGDCGTLKCPDDFQSDCKPIENYKFYLAFENSNCDEYITEKLWWNALSKNSIPIVMGGSKLNYIQLLPPNSFIHVNDFASPADLARYLKYLNKTTVDYLGYFQWKTSFEVKNEHGYFQTNSYHYCRLCEALNYNKRESSIYYSLKDFWSVENDCYIRWNQWDDSDN